MTPVTHPLAVAAVDAYVAWFAAGQPSNELEDAVNATHAARQEAGCPRDLERPSDPSLNTVRAAVAVSTSPDRTWAANGGSMEGYDPVAEMRRHGDHRDGRDRLSWILVDVPLPEPTLVIEATIDPSTETPR